jgi:hypothetical protein
MARHPGLDTQPRVGLGRSFWLTAFHASGVFFMKRPPTGASPCLLGVKVGLLCLHPLYQFFDPIKRSLIGDPGRQALVMLDLAVEFDTLVTHKKPRSNRETEQPRWSPVG